MPRRDHPPRTTKQSPASHSFGIGVHLAAWIESRKPRRRGRKDTEGGGVPVEPDKPKNLSGGAAAALEFDDQH